MRNNGKHLIKKDWNLNDMPDQTGKTVLITGANAGLGFYLTKAFAQKKARVIMACRDHSKANTARDKISNEYPDIRIITTSSVAEKLGTLKLDNPVTPKKYNRWFCYGDSKLAMLMFALILDEKLKAAQIDANALSAHPGYAKTNLRTERLKTEKNIIQRFLLWLFETMSMSGERGALPLLCAATDPNMKGGEYIDVSGISEMHGSPKITRGQKRAYNQKLQEKLWKVTEEKTNITYKF